MRRRGVAGANLLNPSVRPADGARQSHTTSNSTSGMPTKNSAAMTPIAVMTV
ncbi:hypothetical protein V4R08_00355 [Nitrobacter sp. NHB1]|uniref:hypothetical protein n=1 Tax=Nitrobacter sp. NHB1 TaxID=3119830 RepID=UPI002FFDF98B